jgi:hypothetical protein
VSGDDLPQEVNAALANAISLFSALTASNTPEDLRKMFYVISGGKDNS